MTNLPEYTFGNFTAKHDGTVCYAIYRNGTQVGAIGVEAMKDFMGVVQPVPAAAVDTPSEIGHKAMLTAFHNITTRAALFVDGDSMRVVRDAVGNDLENILPKLITTHAPASADAEALREALTFYADERRYEGANQKPIPNDPFQPSDLPYRYSVMRDWGEVARKALATRAAPTNVQGE